ncbi:hypothetical protein AK812_SmicGene14084 [Symbiodinium microadriaticum]|uniref:Uncharacterized protein n=1 Tax=Symbiodinium microadriaticum TaxID=2951 RepID=A0A1Q9E6G6_SYMMI|nr:hypothetical protein AK812_SmicGene14084 [Symbiodinium microadriaticum]
MMTQRLLLILMPMLLPLRLPLLLMLMPMLLMMMVLVKTVATGRRRRRDDDHDHENDEDLGAAKVARSEEMGERIRQTLQKLLDLARQRRQRWEHFCIDLFAICAAPLWRQTEEDKFRAYLAEQEADLKARLEEEYRQREVGSLQLKAQRDSEMAMAQREDVAKSRARIAVGLDKKAKASSPCYPLTFAALPALLQPKASEALAAYCLELSRARSHFLEEQVAGMEAQLSAASTKLRSLEEAKSERDTELRAVMAPSPELKEELQELRLCLGYIWRLREQEVRGEAIAASRDHFKHKVQELCGRLLGSGPAQNTQTQETALTALGVLGRVAQIHRFLLKQKLRLISFGTSSAGDVTNSITEALRKVRQELANLAWSRLVSDVESHWDRADPDQTREEPERTLKKQSGTSSGCSESHAALGIFVAYWEILGTLVLLAPFDWPTSPIRRPSPIAEPGMSMESFQSPALPPLRGVLVVRSSLCQYGSSRFTRFILYNASERRASE